MPGLSDRRASQLQFNGGLSKWFQEKRPESQANIPVNKSPRVILLKSQEGLESLFTRGCAPAPRCRWEAEVIFLADASVNPEGKGMRSDLLEKKARYGASQKFLRIKRSIHEERKQTVSRLFLRKSLRHFLFRLG